MRFWTVRRIAVALGLFLLLAGIGADWVDSASAGPAGESLPGFQQLSRACEIMAERVRPAVVKVFTTTYGPLAGGQDAGGMSFGKKRGSGSGVILAPDGYIVTNAHVVEGARRIQILVAPTADELSQQRSIIKPRGRLVGAQVVGIDRETDLAVLKIQPSGLPYLTLGDSDKLRQGQLVFAFGSPMGLENSVSIGVISSVARQLREEDPMIYIQTDAAINPGNSGGPLVNGAGEVVGINTMIFTQSGGSEGLGFAAPSNIVANVFEQIRTTGHVRRGVIGVRAQTVTPWLAEGLELGQSWGVILSDVHPKGPADRAGLRIGDMILTVNGKPMENGRQFDVNIYRQRIGSKVNLDILRGDQRLNASVEVIERSDRQTQFANLVTPGRNLIGKLGILAIDLDDRIRSMLPRLRIDQGIVVAARTADSPVLESGLYPGDVIHAVNRRPVEDLDGLKRMVKDLEFGDTVVLHIDRAGQLLYVALEIE